MTTLQGRCWRLCRKLAAIGGLGLVGLWLTSTALVHQRIDLTEDELFTLSDGTQAMLGQLEQPVVLWWFYSEQMLREAPSLRNYALRVQDLLEEMVLSANGRLRLRTIDPEPFSADEDRATQWGLQAVPVEAGQPALYLGLAAVGDNGSEEVIPFLHPNRQHFLEYDIARTIARAGRLRVPKIGLISGLPVNGGLDLARRTVNRPWTALRELSASYPVVDLGAELDSIPDDVDVLLVIQPDASATRTLAAIDQFVLAGRPTLVFVDPDPQSAPVPLAGEGDSVPGEALLALFRSWGVEWAPQQVVGDAAHAMLMNVGDDQTPARDLTLLGIGSDHMAARQAITQDLETLNLATAGTWRALPDASSHWQPLLWSSRAAGLIDVAEVRGVRDPSVLLRDFVPDGHQHALMGLLTGRVRSAFAQTDELPPAGGEVQRPVLAQGEVQLLLVADTDLLTDRLWVQVQGFMGRPVLAPFADNGSLLVNAVDAMTGSRELIGVRGRGALERPFTRVHALRRDAELRYRDRADQLRRELQETEQDLAELQGKAAGERRLGAQQRELVDQYLARKLTLRKALREVQRQLSVDIEVLGTRLKLVNIGLVPALLTLLLLAQQGYRRWGRHGIYQV